MSELRRGALRNVEERFVSFTVLVKCWRNNSPWRLITVLVLSKLSFQLIKILALSNIILAKHGLPLKTKRHVSNGSLKLHSLNIDVLELLSFFWQVILVEHFGFEIEIG